MKRNIIIGGIIAIFSIFLFSSRARASFSNTVNDESVNKLYELKNVLSDWKMNQDQYK